MSYNVQKNTCLEFTICCSKWVLTPQYVSKLLISWMFQNISLNFAIYSLSYYISTSFIFRRKKIGSKQSMKFVWSLFYQISRNKGPGQGLSPLPIKTAFGLWFCSCLTANSGPGLPHDFPRRTQRWRLR